MLEYITMTPIQVSLLTMLFIPFGLLTPYFSIPAMEEAWYNF